MPFASSHRDRRHLAGQAMIPVAVLILLALVAGLVFEARASGRSHRATAERALHDYAAFAVWEFTRQADALVQDALGSALAKARRLEIGAGRPLPAASLLMPDSGACNCGFARDIRLAFRVDLPAGTVTTHGRLDDRLRPALERRLSTLALVAYRDDVARSDTLAASPPRPRMAVDTVGGASRLLALTVTRDRTGAARAAYGFLATTDKLMDIYHCAITNDRLLPPSLIGGAPNDSLLRVRVTRLDGGELFVGGARTGSSFAASDTLGPRSGNVVATVELRPELAASLVIGGVPASRLPAMLALLAVASLLAVVALVQLYRGRELARLRSQFVANVSHELRTPLAQISMFSEMLSLGRERSPEERHYFLSVIHREARRLSTLVESVLRFSRGEAVRSAAPLEPRDIAADLYDTVHAFEPLALAAGVKVQLHVDGPLPAIADAGAVRQIVLNLLDNAVKFGPRGGTVTITARCNVSDVTVTVEDEGPGIPVVDRERVFEPFIRLDRPGASRVSGAGIGLAVVRDLVITHGGRVWIEPGSADGEHGTRVSFSLRAASRTEASNDEATSRDSQTMESVDLEAAIR